MGRKKTAIKLHTLHDLDRSFAAAALFHGDHAVLADLRKGVGQYVTDRRIVVAGDRGNLLDLLLVLFVDGRRSFANRPNDRIDALLDAAGQRHRVRTGRDHLEPLAEDRLGQNRRRGRPIASHFVRLAGHLFHQLSPQILIGVV